MCSCIVSALVFMAIFKMHAIVDQAAIRSPPGRLEDLAQKSSWGILLLGSFGLVLMVLFTYFVTSSLQQMASVIVSGILESTATLTAAAMNNREDLPEIAATQASMLLTLGMGLVTMVEGKPSGYGGNPDDTPPEDPPNALSPSGVIPLGYPLSPTRATF